MHYRSISLFASIFSGHQSPTSVLTPCISVSARGAPHASASRVELNGSVILMDGDLVVQISGPDRVFRRAISALRGTRYLRLGKTAVLTIAATRAIGRTALSNGKGALGEKIIYHNPLPAELDGWTEAPT